MGGVRQLVTTASVTSIAFMLEGGALLFRKFSPVRTGLSCSEFLFRQKTGRRLLTIDALDLSNSSNRLENFQYST